MLFGFSKKLYNDIPNFTVWRVLRKRLHLNAYKLFNVQGVEHSPHSNIWNTIVKLFSKHPVLSHQLSARTLAQFDQTEEQLRSCFVSPGGHHDGTDISTTDGGGV
jgi:hypothetical protein